MSTRKSIRAKSFMTRPAEGWLHDSTALSAGAGIFYSFPVRYIGSLQVLQSMTGLTMEQKTEISHEGIARCIEFSGIRKKNVKRKASKLLKDYLADAPYVKVMDLKLNVSTQGLATSDIATNNVISLDEMAKISYAAGGEGTDYDFVTYIAKDKRENRYCHVFDCGLLSDDVLATIGQSFTIMTEQPDLADPRRMYQHTPGAVQPIPGVGNPLYRHMQDPLPAPPGKAASFRGGKAPLEEPGIYDNNTGPVEDFDTRAGGQAIYDFGTAGSFKRPAGKGRDGLYDNAPVNPAAFKDFLNTEVPSGHIYGGDEAEKGPVYGDGRSAWNHLEVKAEGDYATLPALAQAALLGK